MLVAREKIHAIDINKLEDYTIEIDNMRSELKELKKIEKGINKKVTEFAKKIR